MGHSSSEGSPLSENQNGKWGKLTLVNAAVAAYLIYDMSTATDMPRQSLMILPYVLLACALAGSLVKLMSQN
jgi:hypothetical protein